MSSGPLPSEMLLTFHGTVGEEVEEGRAGGDIRETQVRLPFFPFVTICSRVHRQSQAAFDSALLQSSSMLGSGKILTHQELLEKLEDREVRQALDGKTTGKRKRSRGDQYAVYEAGEDETDDDDDGAEGESSYTSRAREMMLPMNLREEEATQSSTEPTVMVDTSSANIKPKELESSAVGSALRRNADGSVVQPRVRQRTKSKQVCIVIPEH